MNPDPNGNWVRFEELQTAEATIAELREVLEFRRIQDGSAPVVMTDAALRTALARVGNERNSVMAELLNTQAERDQLRTQLAASNSAVGAMRSALEAAKRFIDDKYIPWANAGGVDDCKHGYGAGIPCRQCDRKAVEVALSAPAGGDDTARPQTSK